MCLRKCDVVVVMVDVWMVLVVVIRDFLYFCLRCDNFFCDIFFVRFVKFWMNLFVL